MTRTQIQRNRRPNDEASQRVLPVLLQQRHAEKRRRIRSRTVAVVAVAAAVAAAAAAADTMPVPCDQQAWTMTARIGQRVATRRAQSVQPVAVRSLIGKRNGDQRRQRQLMLCCCCCCCLLLHWSQCLIDHRHHHHCFPHFLETVTATTEATDVLKLLAKNYCRTCQQDCRRMVTGIQKESWRRRRLLLRWRRTLVSRFGPKRS